MTREQRNQAALSMRDSVQNLRRRTAQSGIVAMISQVLRLVIQIGGTAVMSRLLLPSDFGLIAMAATVTSFIGLFTDMGLSTATIQRTDINQELVSTLFYVNVLVGVALMIVAVIAAPIAAWFFHDPRLLFVTIGLSLAIPLSAAGAQHGALLLRGMRMVTVQAIAVFSQLAALVIAVCLALKTDAGYLALVAQAVTASLFTVVLNVWACGWMPSRAMHFGRARKDLNFGLHLAGFNFVNYFHRQFDNVLIGWRYGEVELGYYSRAYNLLTLPINVVNSSISQAALPTLARLSTDLPRWREAFLQIMTVACFGSVGLCAVLFVSVEPLIHLLLGPKWSPVIIIFQCLTIASMFGAAVHGCGWAFISLGRSKTFFYYGLSASTFYVVSFVVGLPWKGSGVALAYSVAMAITAPIYLALTARVGGFSYLNAIARLSPPLIAGGLTCYTGTLLVKGLGIYSISLRFIAAMSIGFLVYLCFSLLFLMMPQYGSLRLVGLRFLGDRKMVLK